MNQAPCRLTDAMEAGCYSPGGDARLVGMVAGWSRACFLKLRSYARLGTIIDTIHIFQTFF